MIPVDHDTLLDLDGTPHIVEPETVLAIHAALVTGRPLLLRGEPGTGKTQLALAAAKLLKRPLVRRTIDAHTESRDLLYAVDAVARLAKAQILGNLGVPSERVLAELETRQFLRPGPVWWALDWQGASELTTGATRDVHLFDDADPDNGVVLLLDEIDKAQQSVPNGLLDALGHGEFDVEDHPRVCATGPVPVVIVTTNETRELPPAFLRRCLVHTLALPTDRKQLIAYLVERGKVHGHTDTDMLEDAAKRTATWRERVIRRGLTPPGQAEYLDLVRAASQIAADREVSPSSLLDALEGFALHKHPEEKRS